MKKKTKVSFKAKHLFASAAILALVACSSPEEQMASHYESGQELLEKDDVIKASLEFRNALQINNKYVPAWYGLALVEERNSEWQRAASILDNILNLDPNHLKARVKLSKIMLMAGRLDKALEISEVALSLYPENADVLSLRAAVLLKLDDVPGALKIANSALLIDPSNVDAVSVLAVERFLQKDYEATVKFIDQGLEKNSREIPLLMIKIQALGSMGAVDKAEAVFHQLLDYYPGKKDLRKSLIRFYMIYDRKDDAEKEIKLLAAQNPEDIKANMDVVRFLNTVKGGDEAEAELKSLIKRGASVLKYQLFLAQLYASKDRKDDSKKLLQQIVDRAGSSEDGLVARNKLADFALAEKDVAELGRIIEEILSIDNVNVGALVMRGGLRVEAKEYDDAIADLRTAIKQSPQSLRALLMIARAYEFNGSPELAEERLAEAFRYSKGKESIGLPYVAFLLRHSSQARAEDILIKMLAIKSDNISVLKSLAQVRLMRKNWAGAQEVADILEKLGDKDNISKRIKGLAFDGQKNYDQSIAAFKSAYTETPNAVRPLVSLVKAYVRAGKKAEAMSFLQSVLKANEDNYQALILIGQLHLLDKEGEQAKTLFKQAIVKQPELVLAYSNLATYHIRSKEYVDANRVIEDGLVKIPDNFTLYLTKASLLQRDGKIEETIQLYEFMYKKFPNSTIVINNLASLLSDYRTDDESIQRALMLAKRFRQSSIPHFKDTLGWIYYKLGDARSATNMLKDAVEQVPKSAIFRYHLGMSYMASDRKAAAQREFEEILKMSKDDPFVHIDKVTEMLGTLQSPDQSDK